MTIFMLTTLCKLQLLLQALLFTIFNYTQDIGRRIHRRAQDVDYAGYDSFAGDRVSIAYPLNIFVQLNDSEILAASFYASFRGKKSICPQQPQPHHITKSATPSLPHPGKHRIRELQ